MQPPMFNPFGKIIRKGMVLLATLYLIQTLTLAGVAYLVFR